jgi:hypothetical protein
LARRWTFRNAGGEEEIRLMGLILGGTGEEEKTRSVECCHRGQLIDSESAWWAGSVGPLMVHVGADWMGADWVLPVVLGVM